MKKILFASVLIFTTVSLCAQVEPAAGKWKTWFIQSVKKFRLTPPGSYKSEIAGILSRQNSLDSSSRQQINYWNAGAPGYRWQNMMFRLWMSDTGNAGTLAKMLLDVAIYDATIAAWDTKYAYNRMRPFSADNRIKSLTIKPESPSYPCEYSVTAGVAVTIISHFFPSMADSVNRMAQRVMASRIAAGTAFPSDTKAGFEMGKKIAAEEIAYTKDFIPAIPWDGKIPQGPGLWKGEEPAAPMAGKYKPVVLENGSQFRPGPPPDYVKEMEELKNYKQNFMSVGNAFFYATQPFWEDLLHKKIFEQNIHLNPPRAARMYAIAGVGTYDGFISCWDAKYAYWGIRPEQYDTSFHPILFQSPPFPGYPSGHAAISSIMAELYSYFFPADKAYFQRKAKEVAESRFQGGIHFRTDNEIGLELGKKVAGEILKKIKSDGINY